VVVLQLSLGLVIRRGQQPVREEFLTELVGVVQDRLDVFTTTLRTPLAPAQTREFHNQDLEESPPESESRVLFGRIHRESPRDRTGWVDTIIALMF